MNNNWMNKVENIYISFTLIDYIGYYTQFFHSKINKVEYIY